MQNDNASARFPRVGPEVFSLIYENHRQLEPKSSPDWGKSAVSLHSGSAKLAPLNITGYGSY